MNYGNNGYECGSFAGNLGSAGGISSDLYCEIKWKKRWETGRAGKNYQSVIEKLTEKFEILHQVQSDLSEIKEKLFDKHKQE